MLVKFTGIEGIPRVELDGHAQMHKPIVLESFPEIPRGVGGYMRANLGDPFKLMPALRVLFDLRQLQRSLSVSLSIGDDRLCADIHGHQLLVFRIGLGISMVIQGLNGTLDILFEIEHAVVIDLVIQHGMAR